MAVVITRPAPGARVTVTTLLLSKSRHTGAVRGELMQLGLKPDPEEWSPVIKLKPSRRHHTPRFSVSTLGRVIVNYNCRGYPCVWRLNKTSPDGHGYKTLQWQRRRFFVHREVLRAFAGKAPKGYEACHNDGVSTNNSLSNLRWDTRSSNERDKITHGTNQHGPKSPCAKLNEQQTARLRRLRGKGATLSSLAVEFGISVSGASRIARFETYKIFETRKLKSS